MYGVAERRWEIQVDQPLPMLIALYVRDAAGLAPGDLPPAYPMVHRRRIADLDERAASEQWTAWWDALVAGDPTASSLLPPDFDALANHPDLRKVVAACYDDAIAWAWERMAEHRSRISDGALELAAVHELQELRSRTVRPFTLRVTELPVAPGDGWWLAEGHVAVSSALRADPDAYQDWLIPVLDDVA